MKMEFKKKTNNALENSKESLTNRNDSNRRQNTGTGRQSKESRPKKARNMKISKNHRKGIDQKFHTT